MNEYFSDLPYLGTLYLKSTYLFFEEPILFLCNNRQGKKFLCLCAEFRDEYRWIVAETDNKVLKNLITNKISTYEGFQQSQGQKYIVNWSGYESDKEIVSRVDFENIPELDLPEQNIFLDIPQHLQSNLIQNLQEYEIIFSEDKIFSLQNVKQQKLIKESYSFAKISRDYSQENWTIKRRAAG